MKDSIRVACKSKMQLTVAIPTMNRWRFLKNMLPVYIGSPYINEVIICDENGKDSSEIWFEHEKAVRSGKIILETNDVRLGPYMNKYKSIKSASYDLVALLDSDNIFTDEEYFAPLAELWKKENPDISTIYAPAAVKFVKEGTHETEMPFLKYDGLVVDASNWSRVSSTSEGRRLLNDGNYVVNSSFAILHWPEFDIEKTSGADTFIANYYLVAGGAKIRFTAALGYTHIVHAESITESEHDKTISVLDDPKWQLL